MLIFIYMPHAKKYELAATGNICARNFSKTVKVNRAGSIFDAFCQITLEAFYVLLVFKKKNVSIKVSSR